MSAYIVKPRTIQVIAHALSTLNPHHDSEIARPLIAETLADWNILAIATRYPDTEGKEVESFISPMTEKQWREECAALPDPLPTAEETEKLCGEYDYQTSESDDYMETQLRADILALRSRSKARAISDQQEAVKHAMKEREELREKGREFLSARVPPWAKAAIIAERHENSCDSQSDYFASSVKETLVLAWSKHERKIFSEMRKAAALAPETAHLGPGKRRWNVKMRIREDCQHRGFIIGGQRYNPGYGIRWDDLPEDPFLTEQEARDWISRAPTAPTSCGILSDSTVSAGTGRLIIPLEYHVEEDPIEHRENYSMGHGYYLAYGRYEGWQISKTSVHALLTSHAAVSCGRDESSYRVPLVNGTTGRSGRHGKGRRYD